MATRRSLIGWFAALLLGGGARSGPAAPARARGIALLDCHVAGTSHAGLPAGYESRLRPGMRLPCRREPDNPADALAIRIHAPDGRKLGYVPRARNEVPARLMDAGWGLCAEIHEVRRVGAWLCVEIRVVLLSPGEGACA